MLLQQWISEVLHFCSGLPIVLVGCKMDLRNDQKTKDELKKTNQSPVTVEQVRSDWTKYVPSHQLYDNIRIHDLRTQANTYTHRPQRLLTRSVLTSLLSVRQRPTRVSVRSSNTLPVLHSWPRRRRRRSALFCKATIIDFLFLLMPSDSILLRN